MTLSLNTIICTITPHFLQCVNCFTLTCASREVYKLKLLILLAILGMICYCDDPLPHTITGASSLFLWHFRFIYNIVCQACKMGSNDKDMFKAASLMD